MAKLSIKAGATSVSVALFIQDSSSTTGAGLTGVLFNSSGLTCYAVVPGSSAAAITLATLAAANSAWSSGGFKEIDSTNMPGWYRFDIPNTNISTGRSVGIHFKGVTNMAPLPLEIELTGWDNQDAVRGGMTALPNANAEAAGGLYTRGSGAGQINQSTNGQIDANVARWLNTAVTAATAGIPDVNTKNVNNVSASSVTTINANLGTTQPENFTGTGASALVKVDMVDVAGSAVSTTSPQIGVNVVQINAVSTAAVTTVKAVQGLTTADTVVTVSGNVNGSVGSVTGAVGSVTGNVGGNVVGSVASVTAAVAITSNIKKNQALGKFEFLMTDSTNHNPATGKTVTCTRSIDGGSFASGTLGTPTEIANGAYYVDFGAGDLNGNVIVLRATATGCDDTFERIVTQP